MLLSFAIPVLLPLFDNGSPDENEQGNFTLPSVSGEDVELAEYASDHEFVVVTFHRGADCASCREQLAAFQQAASSLEAEDTGLLAVSLDGREETAALAEQVGATYPMLYDGTSAASTYGLLDPLHTDYTTATVILDNQLRPVTNPIGTREGETLPPSLLVDILRQARGTTTSASVLP